MTPPPTAAWTGQSDGDISARWLEIISSRLTTSTVGHPLMVYESVGSTNDVARELAAKGAPDGTTILAVTQSSGRGRRGRSWFSTPECGVFLSVVLRPAMKSIDVGWLAVLGGVAVERALERIGVRDLTLKWPNDVLCRGRKLAGVLVEPRLSHDGVDFAILGVGANISHTPDTWSEALKETATSCLMEGVRTDPPLVTVALLEEIERFYHALRRSDFALLEAAWERTGGQFEMPRLD